MTNIRKTDPYEFALEARANLVNSVKRNSPAGLLWLPSLDLKPLQSQFQGPPVEASSVSILKTDLKVERTPKPPSLMNERLTGV